MVIITVIYMAFYKKIFGRNLRKQILKTKKAGRLPYEPDVEYEFYEDKVVAIAPETRTECSYRQIERICVVGERYIYVYNSSVSALGGREHSSPLLVGSFLQKRGERLRKV